MLRIENECVDCGLPCLGVGCPKRNVPVYYCDNKDCDNYAEYNINSEDMCEECAHTYLNDLFDELTVKEKAELLDESIHEVGD